MVSTPPDPLLLLLPPSEGKREGGDGPAWDPADGAFGTALGRRRIRVVSALRKARGGNAALLGVGGPTLERARAVNRSLRGAPTMPAWQRYSGVVWDHLGPATLADRSPIVVVSGLHGLVGAEDPLPDYRLKMSANVAPLGKLSTWWRPAVSAELAARAKGRFVVDLLPQEHRAAYVAPADAEGVAVSFVEKGGGGRAVGHMAKAAKGYLARHVVEAAAAGTHPLEAIRTWTDDTFDLAIVELTAPH